MNKATYTKFVKDRLKSDKQWAQRALMVIYSMQTNEEKSSRETRSCNKIGFNGYDSVILSSYAEQLQKNRDLSEKQNAALQRMIPKYARQYVEWGISSGKLRKDANGDFIKTESSR